MPTPGTQVGGTQPTHVASGNITAALPQTATAGDLLLVVLAGHSGSSSLVPAITTPSGWSRVGGVTTTSTTSDKTIQGNYYKVAAGGETSVTFTLTNCGAGSTALATEWAGPIAVPLDQNGTAGTSGASSTGRTDSSTAFINVGPFDLNFGVHAKMSVAATGTPTSSWGAGLTGLYVDPFTNQLSIDLAVSTSTGGVTVTPSDTWTANGAVLGIITKGFSFFLTPTATGSLTLAASGTASASPSASGSLSLAGSADAGAAASASASLSLAGTASAGAVSSSATGSLTLGAAGAGQAPVTSTSGALSLAATASQAAAGSGAASLTLSGAAVASFPPAIATVNLSGSASGSAGASSGVGSLTLSAAGIDSARPSGTASITLAGAAAIVAAATSSATLTLSGVAAAAVRASATASITLGSLVLASVSGTATLTLHGSAIIPQADVTVTLPVGSFTLAAPTPSIVGDVIIGLPAGQLTFTAAAPFIGTPDPVDQILAAVYDRDGSFLAMLPTIRSSSWQEVLSQPGTASFAVPLDDATTPLLTNRRIVKQFWLHGGVTRARFSCRLSAEKASIAVNGRRWLRFEDQPGGMALVGDGTVYPEYGLASSTSATRNFGYMSAGTFWQVPGAWVAPLGTRWDVPGPENAHSHTPPEFSVDPSAQWISRTNPNVTQPYRVAQYFRATFTLATQTDVEILASGDNYMDLYIDGEQIFTADYTHMNAWWSAQSQTIRLSAGEHLIAVRVENGVKTLVRNPVAFICTVRSLDSKGNPTAVLLRTNTTDWVCCDDTPEPGWHRAQVLLKVLLEAQARGVYGLQHVSFGFTYDHDSAGQPWLDRGNYIIDVGTVSLVDVIAQLTEADMDVTFDHAAMRLHAWRRAGADRSGTVALTAGEPDGTLKSYDVDTTNTRFTTVITQLSSGRWVETESASAIADVGRVEAGLSLGSTVTDPSAIGVAQKQIEESSEPLITLDGQTSILDGPQPYDDYFLGDSITVPNQRATDTMKARVMMVTVSQIEDANGPPVQAYPGLVQDRST